MVKLLRRERQNLLVHAIEGVGYTAFGQAAHLAGTDVASNKTRSSRQNLSAAAYLPTPLHDAPQGRPYC